MLGNGLLLGGDLLLSRDGQVLQFGRPEEGLQAVVVLLADRVELVVMAARALHRQPQQALSHAERHFCQHLLASLFLVLVAGSDMARPRAVKPGRYQRLGAGREEFVAGHLLPHEAVIGLVGVERSDHIVAIAPAVLPVAVALEAVRVGEADYVQPLLRPALAVVRRRQERIDQMLVGVWRRIGKK